MLFTMLFTGAKILALVLSIISLVAANPVPRQLPQGQVIGYRTMRKWQFDLWSSKGTVTPDENENGIQIGKGAYTSPRIGDWPGGNGKGYCAITADPIAWNKVPKAWIPEYGPDGNELWGGVGTIFASDKYVKSLGFDPKKTIRMSKILGFDNLLQMVIPPGLTNAKGGGLGLRVECHNTVEGFEKGGTPEVNYWDWKNVKGEPQEPEC